MLPIKPKEKMSSLDFREATLLLKLIALNVNLEMLPFFFFFLIPIYTACKFSYLKLMAIRLHSL